MPLVSVVMSVYRADKQHLQQAIESIVQQTYEELEFIIVLDGVVDKNVLSILKHYEKQDDRIQLLQNKKNIGLTRSLNRALLLAKGTYILRIDVDDIAISDRIEKQVQYMERHPYIVLCGAQADIIDEDGKNIGEKIFPLAHGDIYKRLLFNNQMVHSAWCVRKNILTALGGYDESYGKSQDYALLLKIASRYEVANLSEKLIQWRCHPKSISWKGKAQEKAAIRARREAVFQYGYAFFPGVFHMLLRYGWLVLPQKIKMKRYAS